MRLDKFLGDICGYTTLKLKWGGTDFICSCTSCYSASHTS